MNIGHDLYPVSCQPAATNGLAPSPLRYALVTPARNEAGYIGKTLESVVAQTLRPVRWVIVSDGSTDGTDELVRSFAARHDWIELVRLPDRAQRDFAAKVTAFNAGLARLAGANFDVIGNLDADVSFDQGYFSFLLRKLAEEPALGLVGTPYRDPLNRPDDYRFACIEHVTGPCQLFRRECFEAIGGYMPVKAGAVDRIADIAARMKGWKTRTFTEKVYVHHRPTGTAQQSVLMAKFRDGGKDYSVGTSPLWQLFRSVYQMTRKPFIVGGFMTGLGYAWSLLRRPRRPVPPEMVEFCHREQMLRLKAFVTEGTLRSLFSRNYFSIPFYIPRICRVCKNWPGYLFNYLFRRNVPAQYEMRNGLRLFDGTGTLTGTMAVVFMRREYGVLERCRTIVDIGAHVGSFALYAAQSCPNAKIYCYEPEQQNFDLLKQNIATNGLEGRISAFRCAVASETGDRQLAVAESLLNSFHIVPTDASRQTVSCTTLRDIIASQKLETIDLLKINCEGAEYEILENCSRADFDRIASIRLEYHDLDAPQRNGVDLSRFLQAQGYTIDRLSRYRNSSGFIWASHKAACLRFLLLSVPETLNALL